MENNAAMLSDEELISRCKEDDKKSLEKLIERYRNFIYNVSFKMTANGEDAADLTQEILIKLITKLAGFKGESSFKTWLYRISVNHILNYKKSSIKKRYSFADFGKTLDDTPDAELAPDNYYGADKKLLVEETRQTCMTGMLLCLDEKPRLVFILGELFGLNDKAGSQIMEVSPENFRMMLSRAKKDLYSFMHDKCGLINPNNPCRCAKKTKGFIKAGFVNPASLRFTASHLQTIEQAAPEKNMDMDNLLHNEYRQLYLQHTYLEGPGFISGLNDLLASDKLKNVFNLKNKHNESDFN
jgi:RNA polymerase sigma factor (sigma-70 family)